MDNRSLASANARLREEFVSVVSADEVDEMFRRSADELAQGARVDNFVPLLAERRARERLSARRRT
jgi:hypothetical protein